MSYKNPICGVYGLFCRKSKRCYVGSSVDVRARWVYWRCVLSRHCYQGLADLKADWMKHGERNFIFVVLEKFTRKVSKQRRLQREEFWIRTFFRPYNLTAADGTGRIVGQAQRDKMSKLIKARNSDPAYRKYLSERAKKQHAEGKLGRATWSAAVAAQVSEKAKQRWKEDSQYRKKVLDGLLNQSFSRKEMRRSSYCRKMFL